MNHLPGGGWGMCAPVLPEVLTLDDILITSNGTFEEHAEIMEQVLHILQKANFRANLRKCYFG
jgi:hypothetical protein